MGALKIRDKLVRQYPMVRTRAISTVHAVLDRNGLVKRRKRRRYKARGTPLSAAHEPNGLWCADFKVADQYLLQRCVVESHKSQIGTPLAAITRGL